MRRTVSVSTESFEPRGSEVLTQCFAVGGSAPQGTAGSVITRGKRGGASHQRLLEKGQARCWTTAHRAAPATKNGRPETSVGPRLGNPILMQAGLGETRRGRPRLVELRPLGWTQQPQLSHWDSEGGVPVGECGGAPPKRSGWILG